MSESTSTSSQALAEFVWKEAVAVVQRTTFSVSNGRDRIRLALYLSGLEYADLILATLSRASANISIVPVFRAAFEAWRDLCVLAEDGDHLLRMERDFFRSKQQVLRAQIKFAQSDPETTHRVKALNVELEEVRLWLKKPKLTSLKDEDVLAKTLKDNGVLAMLWPLVCDLSHNNLNALAERHFPIRGSREKKLAVFSPIDDKLRSLVRTKQVMFLVTGLASLRPLVKENSLADFDETMEKLNIWWSKLITKEIDAVS